MSRGMAKILKSQINYKADRVAELSVNPLYVCETLALEGVLRTAGQQNVFQELDQNLNFQQTEGIYFI